MRLHHGAAGRHPRRAAPPVRYDMASRSPGEKRSAGTTRRSPSAVTARARPCSAPGPGAPRSPPCWLRPGARSRSGARREGRAGRSPTSTATRRTSRGLAPRRRPASIDARGCSTAPTSSPSRSRRSPRERSTPLAPVARHAVAVSLMKGVELSTDRRMSEVVAEALDIPADRIPSTPRRPRARRPWRDQAPS